MPVHPTPKTTPVKLPHAGRETIINAPAAPPPIPQEAPRAYALPKQNSLIQTTRQPPLRSSATPPDTPSRAHLQSANPSAPLPAPSPSPSPPLPQAPAM